MAEVLQVTHPGGNLFYRAPISQNVPPLPILFFQDRFWVEVRHLQHFCRFLRVIASLLRHSASSQGRQRMWANAAWEGHIKSFPSQAQQSPTANCFAHPSPPAGRSAPPIHSTGGGSLGRSQTGRLPHIVPRGLLPIMGSACKPMWQSTEDDAMPFKDSTKHPDA